MSLLNNTSFVSNILITELISAASSPALFPTDLSYLMVSENWFGVSEKSDF